MTLYALASHQADEARLPANPLLALQRCQCAIDHLPRQAEFIGDLRP